MNIHTCILDLLEVHDCVIIPGFGGFIGNYSPAHIDSVNHSFQPPAKKLLFNINLKQNDGLLANCVAAYFGTSYSDACQMIDEFADHCKATLRAGKPFIIPQVGKLFSGREGTIQFEQDKNSNLLPDAYGFVRFVSPPIARATRQARAELQIAGEKIQGHEKHRAMPQILKWAAILAIPIGIAVVVSVSHFDRLKISPASDAGIFTSMLSRFSSTSLVDKKAAPPKHQQEKFEYEPAPTVCDQPETGDELINLNTDLKASRQHEKAEIRPAQVKQESHKPDRKVRSGKDDRFVIIVGAFRSKENAEKFIAGLHSEGTQASIFDRSGSGLFRVTIGTFSQKEEALQLLASAKSGNFTGAWLLEK